MEIEEFTMKISANQLFTTEVFVDSYRVKKQRKKSRSDKSFQSTKLSLVFLFLLFCCCYQSLYKKKKTILRGSEESPYFPHNFQGKEF